jgi:hypothetical protein
MQSEQIGQFRAIRGALYSPNIDPTGASYVYSKGIVGAEGEQWVEVRGGDTHMRDVATLDGKDLWVAGSWSNYLLRSLDDGKTWKPMPCFTDGGMHQLFFLGVYKGKLYVQAIEVQSTRSKVFDGSTWRDGPNLLERNSQGTMGTGWRPTTFAGKMVYLGTCYPYPSTYSSYSASDPLSMSFMNLLAFDGTNVVTAKAGIWDFKIVDGKLFVLGHDYIIRSTTDLISWTTIATAPLISRSLAILNGKIYVGTLESTIYEYSDPIHSKPCVVVNATDPDAYEPGIDEGAFTFKRYGNTSSPLTISYQVGGNGVNGVDYASIPSSLTFAAGQSTATVVVKPINDTLLENNETVTVTLLGNSSYQIEEPSMATVNIYDEDRPTVQIVAVDANASELGNNSASFKVSRNGSTAAALTVSFSTLNGAKNGVDYVSIGNSITIPSGSSSAILNINPIADSILEQPEPVTIILGNSLNYNIASASEASASIEDGNAPRNVTAASMSSTQIQLKWQDVSSNERGFEIFRKVGSGSYAKLTSTTSNLTSYVDGNLTTSTQYSYQLRGIIGSSERGSFSNEAAAIAGGGSLPPPQTAAAAPSNLSLVATSSSTVSVFWTDNSSNELGFKIERKTGSTGVYAQIATVGANVTSFSNTGLAASTLYFYRVRATNSVGDSGYCSEVGVTTASSSSLPIVSIVATDPNATESGDKAEFTVTRTGSITTELKVYLLRSNPNSSTADK